MKIDASTLRSSLSSEITTSGGVATLIGQAPDPLLAELFGDVAIARAKYEETLLAGRELCKTPALPTKTARTPFTRPTTASDSSSPTLSG